MYQSYFIGVDISKSKVDCALINGSVAVLSEDQIMNTDLKLERFFKAILRKHKIVSENLLVCCETTGVYSRPLERTCQKLGIKLWVEHAIKIKLASTNMRGKTDRKDALRIAEYAFRYQDKAILFEECGQTIQELRHHLKVRETLIEQKVALENQLREAKSHDKDLFTVLSAGYRAALKALQTSIQKIDEKIAEIYKKDDAIRTNVDLITSIPSVGLQSALQFIIHTNNFKNFSSAKHLACYAGVVPFANESGTITKRSRVSKMANQSLKRLLHMAAMCAVRINGELKNYYTRKVIQGKNKMSALNAVRNKIVHRIYAVIQRQTPYIKTE